MPRPSVADLYASNGSAYPSTIDGRLIFYYDWNDGKICPTCANGYSTDPNYVVEYERIRRDRTFFCWDCGKQIKGDGSTVISP